MRKSTPTWSPIILKELDNILQLNGEIEVYRAANRALTAGLDKLIPYNSNIRNNSLRVLAELQQIVSEVICHLCFFFVTYLTVTLY